MKRKIKTLTNEQLEAIRESEHWLTDTMAKAKAKQYDADSHKRISKEQSVHQHTAPPLTSEHYDFLQRKKADHRGAKKLMWHECEKH